MTMGSGKRELLRLSMLLHLALQFSASQAQRLPACNQHCCLGGDILSNFQAVRGQLFTEHEVQPQHRPFDLL